MLKRRWRVCGRRLLRPLVDFQPGVRLGIDWGKARIGVAACDRDGLLCYPVETVTNDAKAWSRLSQLVAEYQPVAVYLGMPVNLRGQLGPAAEDMNRVAEELARILQVPLRVIDERMSTASAARRLVETGRSAKKMRGVIDQAAAVDILDQALARERHTGQPAGRLWGQKGDQDE